MNRVEFFIEFIKLPLLLILGIFFGIAVTLFSSAEALISHEIAKTREDAINLMVYPKKEENALKGKKNIRDYIIGGTTAMLIMVPELMKTLASLLYLMMMYMAFEFMRTPSNDKTQALATLIIFIISPIGAYYFYEKTVVKTLYNDLVTFLSNHTSIITFERGKHNDGC